MKIIRVNGKYKVADNARFVAEFDTREKAQEYIDGPKETKPLTVDVPEDVNFGEPYESFS